MAPPNLPTPAMRAIPYFLYLIIFGVTVGVCIYYRPLLPDPFVTSKGNSVSVASQYGILLGLTGLIFVLKFAPLVTYAFIPHANTTKHTFLWHALFFLSDAQKAYWLHQQPKEFERIENWLIYDGLYFASPAALDILIVYLLEFIDAASGDSSYPASKYWILPHVVLVAGIAPIFYFMWKHAQELFVNVQPAPLQLQPVYGFQYSGGTPIQVQSNGQSIQHQFHQYSNTNGQ